MLVATLELLESLLEVSNLDIAAGRRPAAPAALTAEHVLAAARARGVPAFPGATGKRLILLSSLGLDLTDAGIRAALAEMHRRGELHLARIGNVDAGREDLATRGPRIYLIEEATLDEGDTSLHVVVVP